MNLTSKRMLQFVMVCAGASALSASAAVQFIADSFEYVGEGYGTTNGVVDMKIGQYKCQPYGDFSESTNFVWTAADGDASKLVAADLPNQEYAVCPRPMEGAPTNLVLNLETEGQTLTRTAGSSMNFLEGAPVYVDTLIKFTPSEDNPVIDDINVKAAVFVNVDKKLVVFHGSDGAGSFMTDTGMNIETSQWYRLTILLGKNPALEFPGFKVYLDGTAISTAQGYTDAGDQPGEWFINPSADNTLNAVAFQGTGMVDELVIADDVDLVGASAILLTLSFNDAIISVTKDGVPVANNGTVETGSEIVIDAADWYEISSVTPAASGSYTGLPVPGALVNVSTGTVSATANDTLTIAAVQYSTSGAISTGLGGTLPANKVAAWALANGQTQATLTGAMLDDYLCNLAPGTNPTLVITSIVVDNNTGIATITVGSTGNAVDFDTINGTLVVYTADTVAGLAANPVPFGEFEVTLQLNQTATIEVDMAGNNFIQAVIQ